eukprot:scaffold27703_cov75-Phaeocystis_antarctica.AAC.4
MIDSIDISSQTTGQKSTPLPRKPPEASGASADHPGSGVRRRVSLHPPAPSLSSRRRLRASAIRPPPRADRAEAQRRVALERSALCAGGGPLREWLAEAALGFRKE